MGTWSLKGTGAPKFAEPPQNLKDEMNPKRV